MELSVDFGGTEVKIGLLDAERVVASSTVATSDVDADLDAAARAARELLAASPEPVDAAGIAVPGVISPLDGTMLHANAKYDFLEGVDLVGWARESLGIDHVAVENDARAALVGEVATGSARGAGDAVMITLGTGIGTAAMIDGVLLRGRYGHAGILGGHVTVDVHGPACPCGNVGCAEALASTRTLRADHPEYGGFDDLIAAASISAAAADLLGGYLRVWGSTTVTLCHLYDPEVVVLSGGVMRAGDVVREPIEEHLHRHLWRSAHRPRVVVPTAPELSVVRGLAVLAAQRKEEANRP